MKVSYAIINKSSPILTGCFTNYVQGSFVETDTQYIFNVLVSEDVTAQQIYSKENSVCVESEDDESIDFFNNVKLNQLLRIGQIDGRTQELISVGFTADHTVFSLSDNAQRNWIAIKTAESDDKIDRLAISHNILSKKLDLLNTQDQSIISQLNADIDALQTQLNGYQNLINFPYGVTTITDTTYLIQDSNSLKSFTRLALGTAGYYIKTGRDIKVRVLNATTIDEINNIIDNR